MSNKKRTFDEPQLNTVEGLTAKLIDLNQQLIESENKRKQMLENISHDLRAPITAIRSSVELLLDEKENSFDANEVARIAKLLDLRTRTLEVLVNDLYYLVSLDNDNNKLKLVDVPLYAFLEEYFISAEIDEKYEKRKLIFSANEDDTLVSIDVSRMTRVLDNLFTNAYKYSEDGASIELGIDGALSDDKSVVFYLADSGIGIPEEKLDKIFERTYMVSDSRTPGHATGSGLGLSIVKGIIEKHNGAVWAESESGKGSKFYISLPRCN